MADRIKWIKDLLGHGTPAEQAAVRNVRQHMLDTGNEKLIIGPTGGPADLSNTLSNTGGPRSVEWPPGHQQWNQQMAAQGEPIFSAHAHPMRSTVVPSQGDLANWAKDYYVRDLNKQGVYAAPDKYSRENMWIAGAKDPNLVSLMPPLEYGKYADTYETLRKLKDADAQFKMNLYKDQATGKWPMGATTLSVDFQDFAKPWLKQLNPEEFTEAYGNMAHGLLANKLAEAAPLFIDPKGTLVGGHDLPIGDLWPEFQKYIDKRGNPIFKAEGGQVEGFQQGGWYNEPPDRYSVSPSQFTAPRGVTTPTFDIPIGKGQATAGFSYDPESRLIDAILGYEHPLGKRGAKLGVQGNFNKNVGPYGNEIPADWGVSGRLTLPFAEGGEVPGYAGGSKVIDTIRSTLKGFRDAPADKLTDWPWRPLSTVAKDMPTEIPQHVLNYGDFMRDQAKNISTEGLDTRDALKAYLTTLSSMQRQAIGREALPGLKLTSDERLIRPEGAYADWLGSKAGQKYLDYAKQGEAHPEAIADAVQNMTPYGFQNLLGRQMTAAPKIVPGTEAAIADQVNRASRGIRNQKAWAAATDPYEGIDAAKKGFFGSLIGYGDRPTLDARQLNLHAYDPGKAKNVMRRVDGGEQAVQRLADRQRALDFQMPWEYDPYYQHLAHHTIWDATSGTVTPHTDLIDMMKNRAEGGQVDDPYDAIAEAQRLMGAYK